MDGDDYYGRQRGRLMCPGNDFGSTRSHRDDFRSDYHGRPGGFGGGYDDYHGRGGGGFDDYHGRQDHHRDHHDDFHGRGSYDRFGGGGGRGHESASHARNNHRREQGGGGGGFQHHERGGFRPPNTLHEDAPTSFGDNSLDEDPLGMLRPIKDTKEDSKPGAFSAHHDAVSAKIAAFDGKSDGSMGRFHQPEEARIEIAPGHFARLRGAKETWKCIEEDFYLPVTCFCCSAEICCIMDASYVLCPQCRVVSPMEGCGGADGGVGLGFTVEELRKWQHEILLKRGHTSARF